MTLVWLIVWLAKSTPALHMWNSWAVTLCVCLAIDMFGGGRRAL